MFFSIIFTGRQNPQILNHDFLIDNKVLPENEEPFKTLLSGENSKPFTDYISTPVITSLKYGPISIIVEENRFQIMDIRFENPLSSPIINITKKYFGDILRFTPFILGGVNFNGIIKFDDRKEEETFDKQLGIEREKVINIFGFDDIRIGFSFSYPFNEGIVEVNLPKIKDRSKPGAINFNYEFKYKDIESFLGNLDDLPLIYEKFNIIIDLLNIRGES